MTPRAVNLAMNIDEQCGQRDGSLSCSSLVHCCLSSLSTLHRCVSGMSGVQHSVTERMMLLTKTCRSAALTVLATPTLTMATLVSSYCLDASVKRCPRSWMRKGTTSALMSKVGGGALTLLVVGGADMAVYAVTSERASLKYSGTGGALAAACLGLMAIAGDGALESAVLPLIAAGGAFGAVGWASKMSAVAAVVKSNGDEVGLAFTGTGASWMASNIGTVVLGLGGVLVGQGGWLLTPTLDTESSGLISSFPGQRTSELVASDEVPTLTLDALSDK